MVGLVSCSGTEKLHRAGFTKSAEPLSEIVKRIPDYRTSLNTLKGKGRAIISEPGNTERVTINFSSNRSKSLVKVRNGIGIEGGQLLTDGDTLLVYNKVDKYARKIPIRKGDLDHINRLASLNILDMLSYSVTKEEVEAVLENKTLYQLRLSGGTEIYINKETGLVKEVIQPPDSRLPYSRITYDAYTSMKGFTLPRRISIFGAERKSKISLQLTGLELNPPLPELTINIPDDIPVYYK